MAKFLGVELAPLNIPFARRLQTLAACHYVSVWVICPILAVWFLSHLVFFTNYWWLAFVYLAWICYDKDTPKRGGRKFGVKTFRNLAHWKYLRDYFPVNLHKTAELDPNRNYMIGVHPHGIMCVGGFTNFATEANEVSKLFPGLKIHMGTLAGQFCIPFRREYSMFTGCIEVSKESIQYCLTQPTKGQAVVLVVGGASEVLDANPGKFDITLNRRKGFIRLALIHGADLVPAFSFGENDVYKQLANPHGSKLRKTQSWLKEHFLKFGPPLFHGRGIFQYSLGLLPYRKPVDTVVGKPINVGEAVLNPSIDQVTELHEKYIHGLTELFEQNKKRFGVPDNVHLNII